MNKLNKIYGFVVLPVIIGGAVLAVGVLGGLAYEYKNDKSILSSINKNNLLAQVDTIGPVVPVPIDTSFFPTFTITSNGGTFNSNSDLYTFKVTNNDSSRDLVLRKVSFAVATSGVAAAFKDFILYGDGLMANAEANVKNGKLELNFKASEAARIPARVSKYYTLRVTSYTAGVSDENKIEITLLTDHFYQPCGSTCSVKQIEDSGSNYNNIIYGLFSLNIPIINSFESNTGWANGYRLSNFNNARQSWITGKNMSGCAKEGEHYSTVFTGQYPSVCCEGLTEWMSGMDTREVVDGKCVSTLSASGLPVGICIKCGDGACGTNESICNCPKDCDKAVCTTEYNPVCAQPPMPKCTEGMVCIDMMPMPKTYSNECLAKKDNATVLYKGRCDCRQYVSPICPSDAYTIVRGEVGADGCWGPGQCVLKSSICTSFSYSNWSTCQSNSSQTRIVVSQSPAGCSGGNPATTQTCSYLPLGDGITPSILDFKSSKTEIISGNTVALSFSGSNVSKYKIYFSCPKFSTGLNAGLLAASVKINGTEYCNKDFTVPTGTLIQNPIISSKYSKPLKITTRLKAHDSQDQYVDYKDVIITVNAAPTTTSTTITTTTTTATTPTAPTTSTATSLQEQINSLLNQINVLQQQLANQQSSTIPTTSSTQTTQASTNDSSAGSTSTSESVIETALSNDSTIFSHTWNNDLYYGMRNNSDVKALQQALIKEGVYSGEATGNFFGLTKQAVIDFQKKHGFTNLPGTGYVGSYTRKVLNELYSK